MSDIGALPAPVLVAVEAAAESGRPRAGGPAGAGRRHGSPHARCTCSREPSGPRLVDQSRRVSPRRLSDRARPATTARLWMRRALSVGVTCCRRGGTCQRRRWVCAHVPRHSAPAPPCDASGSMRLPLLPLLVLPLMLARPAAAGICWTGMDRGGRCSSVMALRVSRAECCAGASRAPAAWSPEDLDSGKIFFYKVLSDGVPCVACAESCAGVSCGTGRRCVVRDGRARCVCAAACRRVGAVCGSDGRTYPSLCRLRRRACRRPGKHLVLDYPGPCQEGSCDGVRCGGDKRCVLDAELGAHCVRCGTCSVAGAPVCAVDGRTYAGPCALRRAACERGKALPLAYRGPCIANATCASVRCGASQRCVGGGASGARCVSCGSCGSSATARRTLCGSDARTYASWCRLQRATCHLGRVVDPLHTGPCKGHNNVTEKVMVDHKVSGGGHHARAVVRD